MSMSYGYGGSANTGAGPSPPGNPWDNWSEFVKTLQLDPNQYGYLKEQAANSARLGSLPGLRELTQRRGELGREYKWGKSELEPAYNRYVSEQRYGLNQTLANLMGSRNRAAQDYDISGRNMGQNLQEQLKRTEQDMARRGLWQSGIAAGANSGLQQKYIQGVGDLERSRFNRFAEIEGTGDAARQKMLFNLSDAQRERTSRLQQLLESYQGQVGDLAKRRQGLMEEEGLRATSTYDALMQQLQQYALQARSQGLNEQKFLHDQYWAPREFDESRRRWDLEYALNQSRGGGGGGYGGYGGGGWDKTEPEATPDELKAWMNDPAVIQQFKNKMNYLRSLPGAPSSLR